MTRECPINSGNTIDNYRVSAHGCRMVKTVSAKMVSNEECRLHLTELATEVRQTGRAIGVFPVGGQPRYELAPVAALDPERVRICVRIGPDRFRRYFGDIRGLAYYDDIPFGLESRGELLAIFQRYPGFRPTVPDAFRAEFASNRGKGSLDAEQRIAALEATMEKLSARLDDQAALLRAIRAIKS